MIETTINLAKNFRRNTTIALKALGDSKFLKGSQYILLIKAIKRIESEIKDFEDAQEMLIKSHCKKNEEGFPIIANNGTTEIINMTEYTKKFNELKDSLPDFIVYLPVLNENDIDKLDLETDFIVTFMELEMIQPQNG
jgi:hypothetical protein